GGCIDEGDVGAVDGGGAGAAVGFEDVAINAQGAFAQLLQVDHGAKTAANEALDLDAAAVDLAGTVAGLAGIGTAGEHVVLRGKPSLSGADQERRYHQVDNARSQHRGPPHAPQDPAGGRARGASPAAQGG